MRRLPALRRAISLRNLGRRTLLATVFGVCLALLAAAPVGSLRIFIPVASAHAYLLRSSPAANSLVRTPPQRVWLEFSEAINPSTSRLLVVDAGNREVDHRDVHAGGSNDTVMTVTLPVLAAGTYVVVWRAESADDGHITGDSFYFRIARPDGSAPPVPAHLPSGQSPVAGSAGAIGAGTLDGPTTVQALATWLAFLALTFWVGGVIWETWILPPAGLSAPSPLPAGQRTRRVLGQRGHNPSGPTATEHPAVHADHALLAVARLSARRFRRLAPYALTLLMVANFGIVLAENAELAGEWSGAFTPYLLHATLFESRFGLFWLVRQGFAALALGLTLLAPRQGWSRWQNEALEEGEEQPGAVVAHDSSSASVGALRSVPSWRQGVWDALRGIPRLPRRLVAGWRECSTLGRMEALLGGGLLVAFALSGHAAAVPQAELGFALTVDILHLLGSAAWIGGLFYISIVLIPSLRRLSLSQRARVLALGLPEFSALAAVAALALAATGSLSATVHISSPLQMLTTAYGRILAIKIELFLVMAVMSAYHAFVLRPRLAHELTHGPHMPLESPNGSLIQQSATTSGHTRFNQGALGDAASNSGAPLLRRTRASLVEKHATSISIDRSDEAFGEQESMATNRASGLSLHAERLAERLEDWLRREALLGVALLLCVALLAAFAGSLASP